MSKIPNQFHNGVQFPSCEVDPEAELRYAAVLKKVVKERIVSLADISTKYSLKELGKNVWEFEDVHLPDLYSKLGLSSKDIKGLEKKKAPCAKALTFTGGVSTAGLIAMAGTALIIVGLAGIAFSIALPFLLVFVWNFKGETIFLVYACSYLLPIIIPSALFGIVSILGGTLYLPSFLTITESYFLSKHLSQRGVYQELDKLIEERITKLKVAETYLKTIISDQDLEKSLLQMNDHDLNMDQKRDQFIAVNWDLDKNRLEEIKHKKDLSNLLFQTFPINHELDLFLREELSKLKTLDENEYFIERENIVQKNEKLYQLKNEFHSKLKPFEKINIYLKNLKARKNNKALEKRIQVTLSNLANTRETIKRLEGEQHALSRQILQIESDRDALKKNVRGNKNLPSDKSIDFSILTSVLSEKAISTNQALQTNVFRHYINQKLNCKEKETLNITIRTLESKKENSTWCRIIDKKYTISRKDLAGTTFEVNPKFLKDGQLSFDFYHLIEEEQLDVEPLPEDIDLLFTFIQCKDKLNFDVTKIPLQQLERVWFLAGYFQIPHFKDVLYNRYKEFLPAFTLEQCSMLHEMFDNTFTRQNEFKTWFVAHVNKLVTDHPKTLVGLAKLDYQPRNPLHEIFLDEFFGTSAKRDGDFDHWLQSNIDSLINNQNFTFQMLRKMIFDKENKLHQMILEGILKITDKIKHSVVEICLESDFKEPEKESFLQAFLDQFLQQSFYPEPSNYIEAYLDWYHPLGKNDSPIKIKIRKAIESIMVDGLTKQEHKNKLNLLLEKYSKDQYLRGLALNCIGF